MTENVGRYRQFILVALVIVVDDTLQGVFQMARYLWLTIFVQKKKSCVTVNDVLSFRPLAVLDNTLKRLIDFLAHRNESFAAISLGFFNEVFTFPGKAVPD